MIYRLFENMFRCSHCYFDGTHTLEHYVLLRWVHRLNEWLFFYFFCCCCRCRCCLLLLSVTASEIVRNKKLNWIILIVVMMAVVWFFLSTFSLSFPPRNLIWSLELYKHKPYFNGIQNLLYCSRFGRDEWQRWIQNKHRSIQEIWIGIHF